MVITIDGPAGTGKSTVSRRVADALGFDFLDTGAMYRAVGYEALRRQADLEDRRELAYIASKLTIRFDWTRKPPTLILNGEHLGPQLRSAETTHAASFVAAVEEIRHKLVEQQQQIGLEHQNLVTEGRDQGSVVFPNARYKFFLTARPDERARRRWRELKDRGEDVSYEDILRQILDRDGRDSTRAIGPLIKPVDAVEVDTTLHTIDQVVELIVTRVRASAAVDSSGPETAGACPAGRAL